MFPMHNNAYYLTCLAHYFTVDFVFVVVHNGVRYLSPRFIALMSILQK